MYHNLHYFFVIIQFTQYRIKVKTKYRVDPMMILLMVTMYNLKNKPKNNQCIAVGVIKNGKETLQKIPSLININKLKIKNMNNSDYPAFPLQPTFNSEGQICNESFKYEGISKREYFAAKAMQAILSNPAHAEEYKVNNWGVDGKIIAQNALYCADELLSALQQPVV